MKFLVALVLLCGVVGFAKAGADEDWAEIVGLDAGPSGEYRSAAEVRASAAQHLQRQEKALQTFLEKYPQDGRAPKAKVRLAGVIVAIGAMNSVTTRDSEALALIESVEKDPKAAPKDQADAGFARVSLWMQRSPPVSERHRLLEYVRQFAKKYPTDPRIASLLAEVATVFDIEPARKRELLNEALALRPDARTKAKIDDDLKRLSLYGQPMRLRASAVGGRVVDVERMRGQPVVILFWAGWSPPSLKQLERLMDLEKTLPRGSFLVVAISLDKNRKQVQQAWNSMGLSWPLICDEKGWESPLVRNVGINSLPTTWILDREGVLRVLNAREDLGERLREVVGGR